MTEQHLGAFARSRSSSVASIATSAATASSVPSFRRPDGVVARLSANRRMLGAVHMRIDEQKWRSTYDECYAEQLARIRKQWGARGTESERNTEAAVAAASPPRDGRHEEREPDLRSSDVMTSEPSPQPGEASAQDTGAGCAQSPEPLQVNDPFDEGTAARNPFGASATPVRDSVTETSVKPTPVNAPFTPMLGERSANMLGVAKTPTPAAALVAFSPFRGLDVAGLNVSDDR